MVSDGANDAAFSQISPKFIQVRCRPGQAARGVNNPDGVGQVRVDLRMLRFHSNAAESVMASDHRDKLALSVSITVDVSLGRLDRAVTG